MTGMPVPCCADPNHIELVRRSGFDMLGGGYFCTDWETKLFAHCYKPSKAFVADAFKSAGLGAWFPDTCPKIRKRKTL
jgi:hypothetical protein